MDVSWILQAPFDFLGFRLETASLLLHSERCLQQDVRLLCGVLEATELSRGAIPNMVVTAPESKINSETFSRFVAQGVLFVAILADGSVVTWGAPDHGGDSSRVQEQLPNVQQISGTDLAFGATLADQSVVTWGTQDCGGDSSRVQDQLRHVQQICSTDGAFAAILADGPVVTWGSPDHGSDSSKVEDGFRYI